MRRTYVVTAIVACAIVAAPATAFAAAPPNEHNCSGAADSALAGPGFGQLVSGLSRQFPAAIPTLFDFANCGNNGNGR
jgi:hypothetical protein